MDNKKNIWIINEYAGSPYHGMEFRHYYLAKEFIKQGYNVTIISATCSHLFKKYPPSGQWFNFELIDGIQYLWIKVPKYTHSKSFKRVLKWFCFSFSLFFLPVKKLKKAHYIILSPMATLPVYPAYRLAQKTKAKFIFEVKDIWPLSVVELGGYSPNHPFIKMLKYFEKFALKRADAIVSVLANYKDYLKEQKIKKEVYYIPNGVDIEELNKTENLDKEIASKIPKDKFIVGYAGTIGKANAMEYFVDAAKILKNKKKIVFVIVGDGDEKNHLMEQSKDLENVLFFNSIPKRQVHSLLKHFNLSYIGLKKCHLFYYGVSPNKIFDYMLAAQPILMAIQTKNSIVEQAQCGICINELKPENIANAILKFYEMDKKDLSQLGQNGKEFVLKHHTFQVLAEKYIHCFYKLIF